MRGNANRAAQSPRAPRRRPEVECRARSRKCDAGRRYYEALIFDMYIVEAGVRARRCYDTVVMDTVSTGLYASYRASLSRWSGGARLYCVAMM